MTIVMLLLLMFATDDVCLQQFSISILGVSASTSDYNDDTSTNITTTTCTDRRPPYQQRRFRSNNVDTYIDTVVEELQQRNHTVLACVFANTFPNTLDTTVFYYQQQQHQANNNNHDSSSSSSTTTTSNNTRTFIITGDIPAMWLRDSTNQVLPYMELNFFQFDHHLQNMIIGLIQQQTRFILKDPYANAHYLSDQLPSERFDSPAISPNVETDITSKPGYASTRINAMVAGIYERKYELDTLCSFLKLSRTYYESTIGDDMRPFLDDSKWITAVQTVITVMKEMQGQKPTTSPRQEETTDDDSKEATYQFQRQTTVPTDTLLHGVGPPGLYTGMIKSSFRPSDDATVFPYLIPSNAMAVVELRKVSHIVERLLKINLLTRNGNNSSNNENNSDKQRHYATLYNEIIEGLKELATNIDHGIKTYGIGYHPILGTKIYAYEVDGYGNMYYADDANIPSLLSLPYLGYTKAEDDPIYVATRDFVWSKYNPWYFSGTAGEGIGSPHGGNTNIGGLRKNSYIWPMSIIMKALTTDDDDNEIQKCITALLKSTANTGLIHESFHKDNVNSYTRPWFSWSNSLFGELIIKKVYNGDSEGKITATS